MPNIPEGAKKPQDHKDPEIIEEGDVSDEEILAELPELLPVSKLRIRQRNMVIVMTTRLVPLTDDDGKLDMSMDSPEFPILLDIIADIDDFAEKIAIDVSAYIEWSEKASFAQFIAILMRYKSAVGDSLGSAN
jgi:hypothetical protein